MISQIRGMLLESTPLVALIEVGGLTYEVFVPLTTAEKLHQTGVEVKLFTEVVYREDSQTLYGFYRRDEREFFRLIVDKVSGIGPKNALTILSQLPLESLIQAIGNADIALLSKCKGIGKKTAERIVIELQDKVSMVSQSGTIASTAPVGKPEDSIRIDAIAALVSLGYKLVAAEKSVAKAIDKLGKEAGVEDVIRASLA